MKASNVLISAIHRFEGCRLEAYRCPANVLTIGYGHTKGVVEGMRITKEEADMFLRQDLEVYEKAVDGLQVCKTQGQFDALVDFAYNLGTGALKSSTLLKRIKAGSSEAEIRYQFSRWNKAGGKALPGLTIRRQWEANRYFEPNT